MRYLFIQLFLINYLFLVLCSARNLCSPLSFALLEPIIVIPLHYLIPTYIHYIVWLCLQLLTGCTHSPIFTRFIVFHSHLRIRLCVHKENNVANWPLSRNSYFEAARAQDSGIRTCLNRLWNLALPRVLESQIQFQRKLVDKGNTERVTTRCM